jgi:hypothetical protein
LYKKLHEKLKWMFSGTAQVCHQVCQFFFVSSVCLLVRVTIVDKHKAVVCCLLATSVIMLAYFLCPKIQVTICALNWTQVSPIFCSFWKVQCLDMMPSLCLQVNWGNCGIPWVNCSVLCVKRAWKRQFWGLQLCLSKLRSLLSFSVRFDVTH